MSVVEMSLRHHRRCQLVCSLLLIITTSSYLIFVTHHLQKINWQTTDRSKFTNSDIDRSEVNCVPALPIYRQSGTGSPPMATLMNVTEMAVNMTNITRWDYYKLSPHRVNTWNFPILINEDVCGNHGDTEKPADLLFLALVISKGDHGLYRRFVRQTWGGQIKVGANMRMAFVVGRQNNSQDEELISEESKSLRDIIQFDFMDAYYNLTIKSMMALKWAQTYCPQAKFILKVDDDVVINIAALGDNLRNHSDDHTIVGANIGGRMTRRTEPWNLPIEQYPFAVLPAVYMEGPVYAVSMSAARTLVRVSQYLPYINLEDVYVTGILPHVTSVTHVNDVTWTLRLWNSTWKYLRYIDNIFCEGERLAIHNYPLPNRVNVWNKLHYYQNPASKRQLHYNLSWT